MVSLALPIFGVGGIGGNWVAGRIGDRFAPDSVLWASLAGLMVVFLALAAVSARYEIALLLLAAWAAFAMLFQAPQQKRLIELAPELRGHLLAMNASALYLGMSVGSLVASHTHGRWGAAALPLISRHLRDQVNIEGPVYIGSSVRIEPGVSIVGPAWIGHGCLLRTGCKLVRSILFEYTRIAADMRITEMIVSPDYCVDRHGDTLYHDDDTTQLRWGDARA